MLVARDVFLDAGGWDEGTFAYYEDVELGWRLWLLGHEVWLAPNAVIYHKHHGTSGRWAEPPRLRLLERNALRMLYTHLETARSRGRCRRPSCWRPIARCSPPPPIAVRSAVSRQGAVAGGAGSSGRSAGCGLACVRNACSGSVATPSACAARGRNCR